MPIKGKTAIALIIFIALLSALYPLILPYDPDAVDLDSLRESPSMGHMLGTDQKGRDVLARLLHGGRVSLSVALMGALISLGAGLAIGIISGYYGGRLDTLLMSVVDLILSFPSLLLAIGVSVILPPGIYTVMIAIASVGWASFARLIRGHVLTLRDAAFVDAARAVGCSNARILFVHLIPQCIPLSAVMMGIKMAGFILTEASLSFLGLGAQPPTASWGSMVSAGRAYIVSAPWMVIAPGALIALTALCFNILGDALSEKYGGV